MTFQEIADAYFTAMRTQDVEALLGLFALDGTIVWPNGQVIAGQTAIRAAYAGLFARPSNNPEPGLLMTGLKCFSCEVHSQLPDGSERRTINVFSLDDTGLVARMAGYRQG